MGFPVQDKFHWLLQPLGLCTMVVEDCAVAITPVATGLQPDIIDGKDKENQGSTKMNENNKIHEHKSYFTGTMSTMQSTVRECEAFGHRVELFHMWFHAHLQESIAIIGKKHAAAHNSLWKTLESGMRRLLTRLPQPS